ncbi:nuclear transport factor 2 family protein [Roseovarius pacificus]|uniref:nuclear transport factor 2 family protein n=1 Tax=Roseovarius pacificus TaxID=337701 RepID=UPI002A1877BC|nr:nuclear transport factor 2 family protein [Roseovarius pacificus]
MPNVIRELEICARAYLDNLYKGDANGLADIFHPKSSLTFQARDKIRVISLEDWLDAVRNRPSPEEEGHPRHDEILFIDRLSDSAGMVKLKCAVPPNFYVDYLCFMKSEGKWLVAQKLFKTDVRN